jgi:hypothetical protein
MRARQVRLWRMADGKLLETVSFGEGEAEDHEMVATDGWGPQPPGQIDNFLSQLRHQNRVASAGD